MPVARSPTGNADSRAAARRHSAVRAFLEYKNSPARLDAARGCFDFDRKITQADGLSDGLLFLAAREFTLLDKFAEGGRLVIFRVAGLGLDVGKRLLDLFGILGVGLLVE